MLKSRGSVHSAAGAAVGAHDVGHAVPPAACLHAFGVGFLKLVGTLALMAAEALDQRIVEDGHVAGSHPHGGRQDDGGVHAHHVATGDDHGAPPFALRYCPSAPRRADRNPMRNGFRRRFHRREKQSHDAWQGIRLHRVWIQPQCTFWIEWFGVFTSAKPTVTC